MAYGTPHFPLHAKPEDIKKREIFDISPRENVPRMYYDDAKHDYRDYYAMVENLDYNVGRILDKLEDLDLVRNTIVVFTSDHGDMMYSHGMHYKNRPHEESVRIPYIIRFPGVVAEGEIVDKPTSLVDSMPTLLYLMGLQQPDCDGKSFAEILKGTGNESRDSVYIECGTMGCRAFDPEHVRKLKWRAVITEKHKACYAKMNGGGINLLYLFDLEKDPYEMNNLSGSQDLQRVKADMYALFKKWIMDTGDYDFQSLLAQ